MITELSMMTGGCDVTTVTKSVEASAGVFELMVIVEVFTVDGDVEGLWGVEDANEAGGGGKSSLIGIILLFEFCRVNISSELGEDLDERTTLIS